jgi:hypothetical protein
VKIAIEDFFAFRKFYVIKFNILILIYNNNNLIITLYRKMDYEKNPSQGASASSKGRVKRIQAQYCDLEGQDDVVCDYEINNASIISDKVTIPDISRHLNLVGKALCRKHYNKLIVNAKKIKITNTCSHPKHNIYLLTARPRTEEYFIKPPERLINYFKLSQTAMMCRHCLYKTDNDPEYINSPIYPRPIQKKKIKGKYKRLSR